MIHDLSLNDLHLLHASLLTPLVLAMVGWFFAAMWAERRGCGPYVVGLTIGFGAAGLLVSPLVALYLGQWFIAAELGVGFERRVGRAR